MENQPERDRRNAGTCNIIKIIGGLQNIVKLSTDKTLHMQYSNVTNEKEKELQHGSGLPL